MESWTHGSEVHSQHSMATCLSLNCIFLFFARLNRVIAEVPQRWVTQCRDPLPSIYSFLSSACSCIRSQNLDQWHCLDEFNDRRLLLMLLGKLQRWNSCRDQRHITNSKWPIVGSGVHSFPFSGSRSLIPNCIVSHPVAVKCFYDSAAWKTKVSSLWQ